MTVRHLFVYPVKSLGGIELQQSHVTSIGLLYDRRYMIVDEALNFMTQREFPAMSLLRPHFHDEGFRISVLTDDSRFQVIPLEITQGDETRVRVFSEKCRAVFAGTAYDSFFSSFLGVTCRLVYMNDENLRQVDTRYAQKGERTSFTDGYPVHIIGTASLQDLNERLEQKVGWERFRPGIVVDSTIPFEEDELGIFRIGKAEFEAVKKCGRCVMTTIDQDRGEKTKEPLKALASYRTKNNKIYFGQYAVVKNSGHTIKVGDVLSKEISEGS